MFHSAFCSLLKAQTKKTIPMLDYLLQNEGEWEALPHPTIFMG